MRFLTGGYTADMAGAASGIGMLHAGGVHDVLAGGPLGYAGVVAACDSPSWLTAHPTRDVVYAALEGAGVVRAFARTGEASYTPCGEPVAAGALVCHIAVAPDGRSLVASCWGDGRVVHVPLDAAGRPGAPVVAAAADDPHPRGGAAGIDGVSGAGVGAGGRAGAGAGAGVGGRAAGVAGAGVAAGAMGAWGAGVDLAAAARALRAAAGAEYAHLVPDYDASEHGAGSPGGENVGASGVPAGGTASADETRVSRAHQALFVSADTVLTVDMGFDLVRVWHRATGGLRPVQRLVLPRGVGPRHLLHHPSGHVYVVTELSQELFVLAADRAGVWHVVSGVRLSPAALPDDAAAEVAASRDARFVYVGLRGSNTVATLRVHGDGDVVRPVALTESGVGWPRHHLVVRDTLLVAGQRSDSVVSLALDERTGVPGRVRHHTAVPSPTCLLPLP